MKKVRHNMELCEKVAQSYSQLTRIPLERNADARAEFGGRIGEYAADQLVFVDESAVDHRTTYRGYGWSQKGHKATRNAFFCRGQR